MYKYPLGRFPIDTKVELILKMSILKIKQKKKIRFGSIWIFHWKSPLFYWFIKKYMGFKFYRSLLINDHF